MKKKRLNGGGVGGWQRNLIEGKGGKRKDGEKMAAGDGTVRLGQNQVILGHQIIHLLTSSGVSK